MAWVTPAGRNYVNQFGQQNQFPTQQTWQTSQEADLTLGIPHVGVTSMAWAINFRTMLMPPRVKFITLSGQPVDQARNMIVENAVGSHIFFLDSDVICPPDTIPRLLKHNLPIVSGLYWRRATPPVPGMYTYFKDLQSEWGMGGHRAILNWEPGKLIQVDAVGAGCLLVDRRVFQAIPPSAVRDWYIKHYGDTPASRNIPDGWFYFGTIKANQMCCVPGQDVFGGSAIQEVIPGESIYNGSGEKARVLGTWTRTWNGTVRRIQPRGSLAVTVTPEHNLLVLKGVRKRAQYGITHRIKHINGKRTRIKLGKTQAWDFTNAKIGKTPAAFIKKGDYVGIPKLEPTNTTNEFEFKCKHHKSDMRIPLTEEFAWLMGVYFAEGSVSVCSSTKNVQLSFSMKETVLCGKCAALMEKTFGAPSSIVVGAHALQVRITCASLARWLHEQFGGYAQDKKVPQFILENSRLWESFIRGVWEGDGYETYGGLKHLPVLGLNIATKKGAIQIFLLLTSLGIRSTIREYTQPPEAFGAGNKIYVIKVLTDIEKFGEIVGRQIKQDRQQDKECSFYYEGRLWLKIRDIQDLAYKGLVYDLNVADEHTYILNGLTSFNSEDFIFNHVAKEYGFPTVVDTSVLCSHVLPFRIGAEGYQALDAG